MYPILLQLPFLQIKTLTVFAFLALFFSAFIFWRKGKEEHYDLYEVFDAFLLSLIFAFVLGRFIFVGMNWSQFSGNPFLIFDLVNKQGNEIFLALSFSVWYLYRYASKRKWDAFEILDFWATAMSLGLALMYLGFFFDGSYGGRFTNMPWGVVFPGSFEKTHPVQLYFFFFYLALFWYLSRMEYQYRTFEWYRKGKKTAQSGFLLSNFLILLAAFYLLTSFLRLPSVVVATVNLDPFFNLLLLLLGLGLLFSRSGRSLHLSRRKNI